VLGFFVTIIYPVLEVLKGECHDVSGMRYSRRSGVCRSLPLQILRRKIRNSCDPGSAGRHNRARGGSPKGTDSIQEIRLMVKEKEDNRPKPCCPKCGERLRKRPGPPKVIQINRYGVLRAELWQCRFGHPDVHRPVNHDGVYREEML